MRKASIALLLLSLVPLAIAQSKHVTIAGCVLNANGSFRLMTKTHTYILKGHQNALFGFNGKMVEISGTEDPPPSAAEGVPTVLHISKIKKLADFCQ
jgi:hypothetical protein